MEEGGKIVISPEKAIIETAYNAYARSLYTFARHLGFDRETSLDCIQDVFCSVIEHKDNLNEINDVRVYLFCSLKNRLVNVYKMRRPMWEARTSEAAGELPFTTGVTIEDEIIGKEEDEDLRRRVEAMLRKLPRRQREVIWLRYMQDMDYPQIAEVMNITVPQSHSLLHRAISNLRKNETDMGLFSFFLYLTLFRI
ncbi:MAG: sigma-70 family RNA polymerase sigma factor [Tannerella sp.]|jgi:RNA polymerase sigma factor (sigma-70 family)|nr:sigma-70 family RNA polymerase sigma factor [Tannerella sp.]